MFAFTVFCVTGTKKTGAAGAAPEPPETRQRLWNALWAQRHATAIVKTAKRGNENAQAAAMTNH
jgi:hypothetical protein